MHVLSPRPCAALTVTSISLSVCVDAARFTTFCVQTGVVTTGGGGGGGGGGSNKQGDNTVGGDYAMEQYVIEYGEDFLYRDRVLSAYRDVVQMRYVPENKKILVSAAQPLVEICERT